MLPLGVSILAYGVAYGVLAREASLSVAGTVLACVVIYSGAAQFLMLPMLATGTVAGIAAATLLVSLRHLLMGASLGPYLRGAPLRKLLAGAYVLNDESYAISVSRFTRDGGDADYLLGAGAVTFLAWLIGSTTGRLAGALIPNPKALGLDFAIYAAFIGLLVPQVRGRSALVACLVAGATALLAAAYLPGNAYILIGGVAGSVAGVAFATRSAPA